MVVSRVFLAMLGLLFPGGLHAAPAADTVENLPGYGPPPTKQYSGFLDAGAAEPGTMLHYWFASASTPKGQDTPIILWLNGGPGSSSILGMLQEQGPLLIDRDGNLMDNPYAWTHVGHFFVLESPAGVGYSYCEEMKTGGSCSNTDISTAKATYAALQDFFSTKFPELRENPFFITGESYAGVYCPTLAAEIVAGNAAGAPVINLVGMAVGDPCTDNASQRQSMDMLWYAHKYGLVRDDDYEFLTTACEYSDPRPLAAGAWHVPLRGDGLVRVLSSLSAPNKNRSKECIAAHRRYMLSSSRGLSQDWQLAYINELSLYSPSGPERFDIPGSWNYKTATFMNNPLTRKALHVSNAPVKAWPGPPPGWVYKSSYGACNDAAPPNVKSMVDFYRTLAPLLPGRIAVYNGDTDPCVSYEGTRIAIQKVGFATVQPTRPWFFNFTAATAKTLSRKDVLFGGLLASVGAGAQFGGQVTDYEHALSFVTVHGSGHMVPTFRPRAALQLIRHVVENTSFAPPVLDLSAMTNEEFDGYIDTWVRSAKSPEYL